MRTVRAECLDWVLIRNDRHLDRILTAYLAHYNTARPHRGINLDLPTPPAGPTKLGTPASAAGRIE
ncbi:integrase core domain-containing protein, partial [Actinophytocola sp.]|uniref:integrase core domain-containing protein n=1 Tax=Actinophytocola sp. TaxID=1872138 RepID=UPI0039C89819